MHSKQANATLPATTPMREAYCGAEMRFQSSPSLRVMYARGFGSLMIRFILRIGDSSCRGPWRSAFFHQAFEANKVRAQNFVHHHFDAFPVFSIAACHVCQRLWEPDDKIHPNTNFL